MNIVCAAPDQPKVCPLLTSGSGLLALFKDPILVHIGSLFCIYRLAPPPQSSCNDAA